MKMKMKKSENESRMISAENIIIGMDDEEISESYQNINEENISSMACNGENQWNINGLVAVRVSNITSGTIAPSASVVSRVRAASASGVAAAHQKRRGYLAQARDSAGEESAGVKAASAIRQRQRNARGSVALAAWRNGG